MVGSDFKLHIIEGSFKEIMMAAANAGSPVFLKIQSEVGEGNIIIEDSIITLATFGNQVGESALKVMCYLDGASLSKLKEEEVKLETNCSISISELDNILGVKVPENMSTEHVELLTLLSEGYYSYLAGIYDVTIQKWQEALKIDPYNARLKSNIANVISLKQKRDGKDEPHN